MATASTPQSPAPRCPTDGPRITAATAATIKWKISANEHNINNANKNSNSPNRWAEQFWQILIDGVNVTNLSKCEKRLFWHRNQQKIAKTVIFLKQKYKTVKMIFASIWPIGYCSFNSGGGISRIQTKRFYTIDHVTNQLLQTTDIHSSDLAYWLILMRRRWTTTGSALQLWRYSYNFSCKNTTADHLGWSFSLYPWTFIT